MGGGIKPGQLDGYAARRRVRFPHSWRVLWRAGLVRTNRGQFSGWGSALLAGCAVGKAVAFAIHIEDADMVGQSVEQRAHPTLGAAGFGPFVEGPIAGDQG